MRVIRNCIDRPTLSWRFKLIRPQQKWTVLVDADHAPGETTLKNMSYFHKYLGHCLIDSVSSPSNGCVSLG